MGESGVQLVNSAAVVQNSSQIHYHVKNKSALSLADKNQNKVMMNDRGGQVAELICNLGCGFIFLYSEEWFERKTGACT